MLYCATVEEFQCDGWVMWKIAIMPCAAVFLHGTIIGHLSLVSLQSYGTLMIFSDLCINCTVFVS